MELALGQQETVVSEVGDLRGRGCVLHPDGVGRPVPCTEGPVQGCDAGELWECGLPG